jgi:hypothetical protein
MCRFSSSPEALQLRRQIVSALVEDGGAAIAIPSFATGVAARASGARPPPRGHRHRGRLGESHSTRSLRLLRRACARCAYVSFVSRNPSDGESPEKLSPHSGRLDVDDAEEVQRLPDGGSRATIMIAGYGMPQRVKVGACWSAMLARIAPSRATASLSDPDFSADRKISASRFEPGKQLAAIA